MDSRWSQPVKASRHPDDDDDDDVADDVAGADADFAEQHAEERPATNPVSVFPLRYNLPPCSQRSRIQSDVQVRFDMLSPRSATCS